MSISRPSRLPGSLLALEQQLLRVEGVQTFRPDHEQFNASGNSPQANVSRRTDFVARQHTQLQKRSVPKLRLFEFRRFFFDAPLAREMRNGSLLGELTGRNAKAINWIRSKRMDFVTRMFVRAQNWHRGQTMTEYALIMAAVAVVVYAGYQTMGTSITGLLTTVDGNL